MKRHNELLFFFSILFFNFFTVECDFELCRNNDIDGKRYYFVRGSFDEDGKSDYYVAMYGEREFSSGDDEDSSANDNYLLWFTFTTPKKMKDAFGISTNDEYPVLEYTWKYNNNDPEGKGSYTNLTIEVCKMKPSFKRRDFVAKYSEKNMKRTFKDPKEMLYEFHTELLEDEDCFSKNFGYKP